MRKDLEVIQQWVKSGSNVLDLGCGDGSLLAYLRDTQGVFGYGIEINPDQILQCVQKGVNVIEQNIDQGLDNFDNHSFDLVVMTQALQVMQRPDLVLNSMLRVGKECIITFPNFGHWRYRLYLLLKGRMPESETLPYRWYNTPNIHLCTFKDFESLCQEQDLRILNRTVVDNNYEDGVLLKLCPNLFGEIAIYHIRRQ